MPAQRKPPGQRRRRNVDQKEWTTLPADGRSGPAPELPGDADDWLDSTREWWSTIWASPMATVWEEADLKGLTRLARLVDDFERDEAPATALAAIQQLEDRFGLNAKARQALGWQIAAKEEARKPARSRRAAGPRRLRAVDEAQA